MKNWFFLPFLLFILCSFNLAAQVVEDPTTLVKIGEKAPDVEFTDENGQLHHLSELNGKLVLINFFAIWCGPCMQELPLLQSEIYDKYKDKPNFVLLVIGREHTSEELKAFKTKKGFRFGLIADPKREIYSAFAKQYIPRNILIGKDGYIISSSIGFESEDFNKLKTTITDLLD